MKCKKCGLDAIEGSSVCPFCRGPLEEVNEDVTRVEDIIISPDASMVGDEATVTDSTVVDTLQTDALVEPVEISIEQPPLVESNIDMVNQMENETSGNQVFIQDEKAVEPVEIPVIPVQNNNNDNNIVDNSNGGGNKFFGKNKKIVIIVGIAIMLIAIILGCTFKFLKRTPKQIFNTAISEVFKTVGDSINNSPKVKSTTTLKMKADFKDASYNELADVINKLDLKVQYEMDTTNKKAMLGLDASYDSKSLLHVLGYLNNPSLYLTLPEVYDKTISFEIDSKDYDALFNTTYDKENIDVVLSGLENAITKSLEKEYFSNEKTTLTINGKSKKVQKSTLKLDFKTKQETQRNALNTLLQDEKYIKSYAKLTNATESEVKENLQDNIDDLKYNHDDEGVTEVSIYTSGFLHHFEAISIKNTGSYSKSEIMITRDTSETYHFVMMSEDTEIVNGKVTFKQENKKRMSDITITIPELGTIGFEITEEKQIGEEVMIPKFTTTIPSNQLTEEELVLILNKLMTSEGLQKLMEKFESSTSGYNNSDYSDNFY